MFNELVIKILMFKKIRPFFAFLEWLQLLHRQVLLREIRTSHHKVPITLYGDSNFNFNLKETLGWVKSQKKMFRAFLI